MLDFTFKSITIKSFRSFKNEQTFILNKDPGLYFISGNNLVEPRLGANGAGKAQPLTSKILTPTGWKLMGDMEVGDKIIGVDGKSYNITGVYPQGLKNIYRVILSDHSSTKCCEDHLWEITYLNNHKSKKTLIFKTKELQTLYLKDNCKQKHSKFFVPLLEQPVVFSCKEVVPINPYIMGILLGDGGLTKSINFTTMDDQIVNYIKANIPDRYKLTSNKKMGYNIVNKIRGFHKENIFITYLQNLKLFTHKSETKFIPNTYKFSSIENRIELLQGLLDSDGHCGKNRAYIEYSSKSKQLAEDVKELVQSLGGTCSIKFKNTSYTYKGRKKFSFAYRLYIKLPKYIIPFKLKRKLNNYNTHLSLNPLRTIQKIVLEDQEQAQCIMTDAPRGLYLTDNYIVTHNSSLWDALVWCLFGKTIQGLKGDTITNWESEETAIVSLHLSKENEEVIITRTQNPNSLTLGRGGPPSLLPPAVLSQADLDSFLNADYDRFNYALILGQATATFLDMKPATRLDLFSDIMSLGFWERRSKIATDTSTSLDNTRGVMQPQKSGILASLETEKRQETGLRANHGGFERDRQAALVSLSSQADNALSEIRKINFIEKSLNEQVKAKQQELEQSIYNLERQQDNINKITKDLAIVTPNLIEHQTRKSNLTSEFNKWKTITNKCPHCDQRVEPELTIKEKTRLTKEIVKVNKSIKDATGIIEEFTLYITINQDKQKEARTVITTTQISLVELKANLAEAEKMRSLLEQQVRGYRDEIAKLETGANPFDDLLTACLTSQKSRTQELKTLEQKIESLNKQIDGNKFWVKGFKELRLWLISDALSALEIEANNTLSKLGLIDWKIKFQIERETTTGGISKGLQVLVNSKNYTKGKYIPLETWSGGEKQRLKLGTVIGLNSLIQNYKGIIFNISVWDEPSSYLSDEGINDLIEFLADQATITNKCIYFVDQRHLESNFFKSVIMVTKSEQGSYIQEN
jgi:DNA repair exonuclease SbcCD ATPase subunit